VLYWAALVPNGERNTLRHIAADVYRETGTVRAIGALQGERCPGHRRDTTGVKGIELADKDSVVGMMIVQREATILVVTANGMGKCSNISDYRVQKRGGKGLIIVNRPAKTGDVSVDHGGYAPRMS
jgi:DNA gyrase/topoisomerase IV subunit A